MHFMHVPKKSGKSGKTLKTKTLKIKCFTFKTDSNFTHPPYSRVNSTTGIRSQV